MTVGAFFFGGAIAFILWVTGILQHLFPTLFK